jgi:hypothetical protein
VAQAAHGRARFGVHAGEEGRMRGVEAAGEQEVLPDEHAEFVAGVVEGIVFVDAAAPDAQHGHVPGRGLRHAFAVALRADAVEQVVVGNPVRTAAEDVAAVDFEVEGATRLASHRLLHETQPAQAELAAHS